MSQAEQEAHLDDLDRVALGFVKEALDCILVDGTTQLDVSVHKVGINKETIEAKISIDRDSEEADLLMHGAYKPAKISFAAKTAAFTKLGDRPQTDLDQPEIFGRDAKNVTVLGRPQPSSTPMAETSGVGKAKAGGKTSSGAKKTRTKAAPNRRKTQLTQDADLA